MRNLTRGRWRVAWQVWLLPTFWFHLAEKWAHFAQQLITEVQSHPEISKSVQSLTILWYLSLEQIIDNCNCHSKLVIAKGMGQSCVKPDKQDKLFYFIFSETTVCIYINEETSFFVYLGERNLIGCLLVRQRCQPGATQNLRQTVKWQRQRMGANLKKKLCL